MNKKFEKRFIRLQGLMGEYESEIKNLTYDEVNKKPANGGWSMAELIYHISHSEKSIIQYIQKKLIKPEESKSAGLKSWYRSSLLSYALRSKRKFRAPKVLDDPKGPYEPSALFSEWRIIRATFNQTLSSVYTQDVNRQFFKHPVVGKINLYQTLGFMGHHMQRHLDQLRRVKKEVL